MKTAGARSTPDVAVPGRRALPPFIRGFRAAVAFLTRVPVGGHPFDAAALRWASAHHPAVGALIGLCLGGLWMVLAPRVSPLVTAVLVVAAGVALTGALHEDGLADTADALFGGATRDDVFRILKDSRIGAFGALAVLFSVMLRVASLASAPLLAPAALVVAHGVSRCLPVWLMYRLPYVTPAAVARNQASALAGPMQVACASMWTLGIASAVAASTVLPPGRLLGAALGVGLVGVLSAWRYRARVGGVTGDLLGAAQQIGECVIVLVLTARA